MRSCRVYVSTHRAVGWRAGRSTTEAQGHESYSRTHCKVERANRIALLASLLLLVLGELAENDLPSLLAFQQLGRIYVQNGSSSRKPPCLF